MDDLIFEAREYADQPLRLKDATGKVREFPIRILDMPTWGKYRKAADEYTKAERNNVRIQMEREKAESEGREYQFSERDLNASSKSMENLMVQLQFFVDVSLEDLTGYTVGQVAKMLTFVIQQSSAEPDETADKKKDESSNGTTSSD